MANVMIRGTTPTITMRYSTVNTAMIDEAVLTIKQRDVEITKTLAEATISDGTLSWRLTQAETLSLHEDAKVELQCRYRLLDGTAGTSAIFTVSPYAILKDGVI